MNDVELFIYGHPHFFNLIGSFISAFALEKGISLFQERSFKVKKAWGIWFIVFALNGMLWEFKIKM